jgi:hypothetical protein
MLAHIYYRYIFLQHRFYGILFALSYSPVFYRIKGYQVAKLIHLPPLAFVIDVPIELTDDPYSPDTNINQIICFVYQCFFGVPCTLLLCIPMLLIRA